MSDKDADKGPQWPGIAFLDVLRPAPDQQVSLALIATYSVDLIAVVAAMLALAGQDEEDGSGSKVAFAQAFEQLRGRFRVVCQTGRLSIPHKTPQVLTLMDRFVREVRVDESRAAWHPKLALVGLAPQAEPNTPTEWRLWLGSRNLTRTRDLEAGLVLVGKPADTSRPIPGIAELAEILTKHADLPSASALKEHLLQVQWQAPKGVTVDRIDLFPPNEKRPWPKPPDDLRRLTVISPFLDVTGVQAMEQWGNSDTKRQIVSTWPALQRIGRRHLDPSSFEALYTLTVPRSEDSESPPSAAAAEQPDDDMLSRAETADAEQLIPGLHAKLYLLETTSDTYLWLGSANATRRGLSGPNAEVMAFLTVSADVGDGLINLIHHHARVVQHEELPAHPDEDDKTSPQFRLEKARNQVAANWEGQQKEVGGRTRLQAKKAPHPEADDIELAVAHFPEGEWVTWPRGTTALDVPGPRRDRCDFLKVRLSLEEHSLAWLQRTPLDIPRTEEDDMQILARSMDPRIFLQWVRALLHGHAVDDGGGAWDEVQPASRPTGRTAKERGDLYWAPTIEDVLRAWSRDANNLADVDRRIRRYLDRIDVTETSVEVKEALATFQENWQTIVTGLGVSR